MFDGPVYVDPPSGWRFGFPKIWDQKGDIGEWLKREGYPLSTIAMHYRTWPAKVEGGEKVFATQHEVEDIDDYRVRCDGKPTEDKE